MRDGPILAKQIFEHAAKCWPHAPDWLLGETAAIETNTRIAKYKQDARWRHDLPPMLSFVLALLGGQSALAVSGCTANSAATLVCCAFQHWTKPSLAAAALDVVDDLPLSAHQRLEIRAALKRKAGDAACSPGN